MLKIWCEVCMGTGAITINDGSGFGIVVANCAVCKGKGHTVSGQFTVIEAELAYKTVVKAKPVPHYYNAEQTYIKYRCPICEPLNIPISITPHVEHCPTCHINLDWEGVLPSNEATKDKGDAL